MRHADGNEMRRETVTRIGEYVVGMAILLVLHELGDVTIMHMSNKL